MVTREELQAKWDEVQERWEELEAEGNPFDLWNNWLNERGLVESCYFECNWNPINGIDHVLDWLVKMANRTPPVFVIDDPHNGGYLAFERE